MSPITFTFEGDTPSKKNSKRLGRLPNGRPMVFSSFRHKAWRRNALFEVKAQMRSLVDLIGGNPFPIARAARCRLVIHYKDQRRHDNSNLWESVADLMVDAGVLADDSWQVTGETVQEPRFRAKRPGWELEITLP